MEAELRRLRTVPVQFTLPSWPVEPLPPGSIKVIFHNVENLREHLACTFADQVFSTADLVLFAETWSDGSDDFNVKQFGFEPLMRIDGDIRRAGCGSLVAVKQELRDQSRPVSRNVIPVGGGRIELCVCTVGRTTVVSVYSSPQANLERLWPDLQAAIHNRPTDSLLVIGDFNINLLLAAGDRSGQRLTEAMRGLGLVPLLRPNDVTTNQSTQIDLAFSNCPDAIARVYESGTSYHKPQFVTDPYACVQYIVNYINKTNRGMSKLLREVVEETRRGNYDYRRRLQMIGNKFINSTEISAQEAAYLLLQLPVSELSRSVKYINTAPPEERVRVIKPREQLEAISRDQDSDEVFETNYLDYYVSPLVPESPHYIPLSSNISGPFSILTDIHFLSRNHFWRW